MGMASDEASQLPGLPGYNKDNLQPWTVAVVTSVTVLAVVTIGLRLLSRRIKHQQLWWDDKMILFSMAWNLVVVGFIFAMYSSGMGRHADQVHPENIVMMAKWLVVAEVLYAWNLGWTKTSVLLMYYRIFRLPYFKKMAWIVGAIVWAWVICITFLFIFICVPVQKLWYEDLPGRCINQVGTWISNAASTLFTDLVILLMPIPQIWKLQLRTAEKIGLTLAFSLGFFVVFASAYRTSVLFTYAKTDPTYTLAPTVGWTAIEMSAGIISACLPTLLPIALRFAKVLGYSRSASVPSGCSNAPPTFGGTGGSKPKYSRGSNNLTNFSTRADDADFPKTDSNPFYRLPDTESESVVSRELRPIDSRSDTPDTPLASKLRPDMKGYGHTVQSYTTNGDRSIDDDIPLQGIRVQTDLKQSSSKKRLSSQ